MSKAYKVLKKITPYSYATKKIPRKIPRKIYANYSRYKPFLREEFGAQCVYCRKADIDQDASAFHVDHYKPKSLYQKLRTEYTNLFYCCAHCNIYKDDHPSDHAEDTIPNPCSHVMSQHLKFSDEIIIGLTTNGRFTEELLRFNDEHSKKFRREFNSRVLLLIEAVLEFKGRRDKKAKNLIDEAIRQLARMTIADEAKVRKVLL